MLQFLQWLLHCVVLLEATALTKGTVELPRQLAAAPEQSDVSSGRVLC